MPDDILQIHALFEKLGRLLRDHRGQNHLPGVIAALRGLEQIDLSSEERKTEVRSILKSMLGGAGTLGDFVIAGKNETDRQRLNKELDSILDELWNLLN